ncbi:MAG: hypothetical protein Q9198_004354 [Flavoplaca austrocitrina]
MGKQPAAPAYVLGVGLTKFVKPRGKIDYTELGFEAGIKALLDAQINYDDVDQGVACYCYGDSTCGQRVFYQFGMTQIPIYNVNNNCSTGSTGLHMARQAVSHGAADCVMVVGFEKMFPGSLQSFFKDRTNPTGTTVEMMKETRGVTNAPGAAQMFGNAGREYMEKYGATPNDFAEIARINHAHSAKNPYSQFQDVYTLDQILSSPTVHAPLTKLQCCPTSAPKPSSSQANVSQPTPPPSSTAAPSPSWVSKCRNTPRAPPCPKPASHPAISKSVNSTTVSPPTK